jgi:hypothetical protein
MGFFTIGTAVILVALQASLVLLNRDPTSWTFTLVQKADVWPDREALAARWKGEDRAALLEALRSDPRSGLAQCVLKEWGHGGPLPGHCLLWCPVFRFSFLWPPLTRPGRHHPSQHIQPILSEWNPHILLLCLACIHCITALYARAEARYPRPYAAGASFMERAPAPC